MGIDTIDFIKFLKCLVANNNMSSGWCHDSSRHECQRMGQWDETTHAHTSERHRHNLH